MAKKQTIVAASVFALWAIVNNVANAQSPIQYQVHNILREISVRNNNYMTSPAAAESARYPSLGAIFYVPSAGNLPLYRLYNGADHMDSLRAGEGGYLTEGVIGYPYTSASAVPGLTRIDRFVGGAGHATNADGYGISGYTLEGGLLYGYRRYFNAQSLLVPYSGGGVTEQSDSVGGGAVYSWTWNGVQFINTDDFGRYMQSDIFFHDKSRPSLVYNPNEAGDEFGRSVGNPQNGHGSPTIINQVVNGIHSTRAAPLEWASQEPQFGSDPDHVLIYNTTQIGKDLTLNYAGLGPVAQYKTHFILPNAISSAVVEIPTAYLTGIFQSFYTYDAAAHTLNQVSMRANSCGAPVAGNSVTYTPPSGYGGIIVATANGAAAMGVYGLAPKVGGPVSYFTLDDFRSCGNTAKWSARYQGSLQAGDNAFNTYVVTGTLTQVQTLMISLYNLGAH